MRSGYALFHAATQGFRRDAQLDLVDPPSMICACCNRPWDAVEDPGEALIYQYASSGFSKEYYCTTCYTPRLGSESMLGVERRTPSGSSVFGKLGMLPGSGGVITPLGELHLALPQGFIDKYQDGVLGRLGRLHRMSSFALLSELLAQGKLDGMEAGFVFVETWGRKADDLMRHWRASYSLSETWCVSEKGAVALDLQAMITSARLLTEQGLEKKAISNAFWRPIVNAAKGQRNDKAIKKWADELDDPVAVLRALPVDPHNRLRLPAVMREIVPKIQEGVI